jgi:hypothetical protein
MAQDNKPPAHRGWAKQKAELRRNDLQMAKL